MRVYHILRPLLLTALFASPLLLSGCDSSEEEDAVAGAYETTTFTAEIGGETTDVLDAGGFIDVTLREDGTVSGRLFVPEELAEGEENDIPFAGTYTVDGNTVTFDHEADTFVRGAVWTYDDGTLRTETDALSVVLRKE